MAVLRYIRGAEPSVVTLDRPVTVGRDAGADVVLDDRGVSKVHARFEPSPDGVCVIDAGSTNGTYVNRRRVTGSRFLKDGDVVLVGRTEFEFRMGRGHQEVSRVRIDAVSEADASPRLAPVALERVAFPEVSELTGRDDLERAYKRLRIAWDLSRAVFDASDLEQALGAVLDAALGIFEADRAVAVLEGDGGRLETVAYRTRGPDATELLVSRTFVRRVLDERAAVMSVDVRRDARFDGSRSLLMSGVRATMGAPLLDAGRAFGVIYLVSTLALGAFVDHDFSLLSHFARAASDAVARHAVRALRDKERSLESQLSRLLPGPIVADILRGSLTLSPGGQVRAATVLFADIRGFTALAEALSPVETVELLNGFFDVAVDVIFEHGGTVDKFIGDALMAVWGGHVHRDDHASAAVSAALELRGAVRELNETRRIMGSPEIGVGIGLATGEVLAGYIGSARAMSHTVIGDVVNTAARVCGLAGAGEVLATEASAEAAGVTGAWERRAGASVKGKARAIVVYRAPGLAPL